MTPTSCDNCSPINELVAAITARYAQGGSDCNRALMAAAGQAKVEAGAVVRIDSTVTAALMHEPSDSAMLWDAVRLMTRRVAKRCAALAALLGKDAPGLSASTIARLKEVWLDEFEHWRKRDLSAKRYVYVWADGIYLQARLEDTKQCILVIIGATRRARRSCLTFPRKSGHRVTRISPLPALG